MPFGTVKAGYNWLSSLNISTKTTASVFSVTVFILLKTTGKLWDESKVDVKI
jgi:hypothetical protein